MTVHSKLQAARVRLQSLPMKKSGNNKFAGYQYFELGDFLPSINQIFSEVGLCSVVSFSKEAAILRVVDTTDGAEILFETPIAESQLKGCTPMQNIGASQTYARRYLFLSALEVVEHDALDALKHDDIKPIIQTISDEEQMSIKSLAESIGLDISKILDAYKVSSLKEIKRENYSVIINGLEKKRVK